MGRLVRERAVLVIIDVQEKLVPVIHESAALLANLRRLVRGAEILDVPTLVTEQYVKGLGTTVQPLAEALGDDYKPIEKMCFSSTGCGEFMATLTMLDRKQVILCGIETHVCVYQTAIDLLEKGYEVYVVVDAVSSRSPQNRDVAIRRMESDGAKLTTTEMALFELTVTSGTDEFRAISKLVR